MVLVARAHVGSNPTYHPLNILKETSILINRRSYRRQPIQGWDTYAICIVIGGGFSGINGSIELELYGIVECKGIILEVYSNWLKRTVLKTVRSVMSRRGGSNPSTSAIIYREKYENR